MTIEIELLFNGKKFIKKHPRFLIKRKKFDTKYKMNKDDKKM